MMPIINLLNKIKWDKRENPEQCSIGYFDRVHNATVKVPFPEMKVDDKFSFTICDEQGEEHNMPFHRIKKVWKNNELIWERR